MTSNNTIQERNLRLLRRHYKTCNCLRVPDNISICVKCDVYKQELKSKLKICDVYKQEQKSKLKIKDHSEQNTDHRAASYVGPSHKICSNPECGKVKHITEFHKTRRKYRGIVYVYRHAKCNECRRAAKRKWYAEKKKNTTKK